VPKLLEYPSRYECQADGNRTQGSLLSEHTKFGEESSELGSKRDELTHKLFGPNLRHVATRGDMVLVALDLRRGLPVSIVFSGFELRTELLVCHEVRRVANLLGKFWIS
jgi:hypothetical protein